MDTKKLVGIVILMLLFLVSCSGNYGEIKQQSFFTEDKVTLAELRDNWEDYDVYYGMRSGRNADAIMFDPKKNGKKLEGDSWIKIEDQETLDQKIYEIQGKYNYAKVHTIEGADESFFGYIYYPTYLRVLVEIVDERTHFVSSLPKYRSAP